ncbi:hypothetical protein HK103_002788 [Boothiomyces macroporosus]|uniref:Uncharacterized protein n=1 Tax=Boothiomyces macroporosus TaxID=261099 RepID=A0AAD5YBA8_9FUNG|nr:hypothetical protein HK103_002761 [Boothiomyces macroporosus]KAJ3262373.1 hypothetical protein HK103_002788 [Boothiomyces macroporosus]
MIWPTFILFGSYNCNNLQDLDTIKNHILWIRQKQVQIAEFMIDTEFQLQMKELVAQLGNKLPNELKFQIIEQCEFDHEQFKLHAFSPMLWQSKCHYRGESIWARNIELWTLFTGFGDILGTRKYYPIGTSKYWFLVFSRDAAILTASCLLRYTLIIWLTKDLY